MELTNFLLIAILILLIFIIYQLFRKPKQNKEIRIDENIKNLKEDFNTRIKENTEAMTNQMRDQGDKSLNLIKEITREITEVKETNKNILSFTDELSEIGKILKNPQRRGVWGEKILEQIISNVIPANQYKLQHSFQNGKKADAVIKLMDDKIVSIDAKFSLDNYVKLLEDNTEEVAKKLREDIKKRIDETAKYIIPEENTLDFAFMFIPSESLYYDILTNKVGSGETAEDLIEYAFKKKRVIIISPTTLIAYIQTIHLGMRSFKIEKEAEKMLKELETFKNNIDKYTENLTKVGRGINAVVNHFNNAQTNFRQIDKGFLKFLGKSNEFKSEEIEKPKE